MAPQLEPEGHAMRYLLLLRGINVGGKRPVPMKELKKLLEDLGCAHVSTYINSGNAFFSSDTDEDALKSDIRHALDEAYPFDVEPVLLSEDALREEASLLPSWWHDPLARRDALFLTEGADAAAIFSDIEALPKVGEKVAFGKLIVFWGIVDKPSLSRSSFHRCLLGKPWYKELTMRNGNTFDRLCALMEEKPSS